MATELYSSDKKRIGFDSESKFDVRREITEEVKTYRNEYGSNPRAIIISDFDDTLWVIGNGANRDDEEKLQMGVAGVYMQSHVKNLAHNLSILRQKGVILGGAITAGSPDHAIKAKRVIEKLASLENIPTISVYERTDSLFEHNNIVHRIRGIIDSNAKKYRGLSTIDYDSLVLSESHAAVNKLIELIEIAKNIPKDTALYMLDDNPVLALFIDRLNHPQIKALVMKSSNNYNQAYNHFDLQKVLVDNNNFAESVLNSISQLRYKNAANNSNLQKLINFFAANRNSSEEA